MEKEIKLPPPGLWFTKDKWKYTESQWSREIGYGELPSEHKANTEIEIDKLSI